MVSVYSVLSAVAFYNVGLAIIVILRRKTKFMAQYAISTLLFLVFLSFVRLITPIDISAAYIVESHIILPGLIDALRAKPFMLPFSIGHFILAVWSIGTVYHLVKLVIVELRAYKAMKMYPRFKSEQVQRVSAAIIPGYDVKVSPAVSMPYTVGILKPEIYLPILELSDEQLQFVLMHELQHIKSRDNMKRLLFLVVEAIFWWNPLAHVSVNEYEMLVEIQCDSKVTAAMDSNMLKSYMQTMIDVMKQSVVINNSKTKLATSFAQTNSIKQRFEVLLLRKSRKPKYMRYTLCFAMMVFFVMSYFVILQPYYSSPASDENISMSTDAFYIAEVDDSYLLIYGGEIVDTLTEDDLSSAPYNEMRIIGG